MLICAETRFDCFQEITYSIKPECPVLLVATPDPEGVDPLGGQLGHGSGSGQLELPLLPDWASLSTCSTALMPMVSGDTHLLSVIEQTNQFKLNMVEL